MLASCLANTGSSVAVLVTIAAAAVVTGALFVRAGRRALGALLLLCAASSVLISRSPHASAACATPSTTTTSTLPAVPLVQGVIKGLPYVGETNDGHGVVSDPNANGTARPVSTWISSITASQGSTHIAAVINDTISDSGVPYNGTQTNNTFTGTTTFTFPGITPGAWTITVTFFNGTTNTLTSYYNGPSWSYEPYDNGAGGSSLTYTSNPQLFVDGSAVSFIATPNSHDNCATASSETAQPVTISSPGTVLTLGLLFIAGNQC